jgi:hypothetical protein
MSKKYVIDLPDDAQYILINGKADNKYYTAVRPIAELEELNSDYINEHYGELQDEAYQAGLNDAWEAAQKVVCKTTAGGMSLDTLKEIFGVQSPAAIMQSNTAPQAIDKIKNYEDKRSDRIEVGDIVDVYGNLGVVTYMYELRACVMMIEDGSSGDWNLNELKKTGKHYDIASILEAMRNDR